MSATETVGVVVTEGDESSHSYMEWGAVFAGAFVAAAISLVLFTFGGGVGLSISSPLPSQGDGPQTLSYLTMAWVLAVMIFSFIAGGYIAGRVRRPVPGASTDSVEFRDGAHGLVVWAAGLLLGAFLSAHMAGAVNVAPGNLTNVGAYNASIVLRGGDDVDSEDRFALAAILGAANVDGALSERDRKIAVDLISNSTRLDETQARARLQEWESGSRDDAERHRKVGAISAFLLAASALVAGAAAYFAAGIGGRHRDLNSPFPWTRARAHR